MSGDLTVTAAYGALLTQLKQRIQSARSRAVLAVNAEQIALYHEIGRELLARREAEGCQGSPQLIHLESGQTEPPLARPS